MVKVRNESPGARTARMVSGDTHLIEPGETRDLIGGDIARLAPGLVEVNEVPPMPESLAQKVAEEDARSAPPILEVDEVLTAEVEDDTFAGFLDRSIPKIAADLAGQSAEDLAAILRDERRGKSRKGLVLAIEAELAARKP